VKVESPNEQPQASADDESINVCAPDWLVALLAYEEVQQDELDAWIDWPPADEGAA
jgi:hypothetical protein